MRSCRSYRYDPKSNTLISVRAFALRLRSDTIDTITTRAQCECNNCASVSLLDFGRISEIPTAINLVESVRYKAIFAIIMNNHSNVSSVLTKNRPINVAQCLSLIHI